MTFSFLRLFSKNNRTRTPAKPAFVAPAPVDGAAPFSNQAVAEAPHVDYDRQPLAVTELDHYIEPIADTERFHVH